MVRTLRDRGFVFVVEKWTVGLLVVLATTKVKAGVELVIIGFGRRVVFTLTDADVGFRLWGPDVGIEVTFPDIDCGANVTLAASAVCADSVLTDVDFGLFVEWSGADDGTDNALRDMAIWVDVALEVVMFADSDIGKDVGSADISVVVDVESEAAEIGKDVEFSDVGVCEDVESADADIGEDVNMAEVDVAVDITWREADDELDVTVSENDANVDVTAVETDVDILLPVLPSP